MTGPPRPTGRSRPMADKKEPKDLLQRLGYIPEDELANLLGISVRTLKNRPLSNQPAYVKAGRRRLYEEASVREFLARRRVSDPLA